MRKIKIEELQGIGRYERKQLDIPIKIFEVGGTKTQQIYMSEVHLAQKKMLEHLATHPVMTVLFDRRKAAEKALEAVENTIREKYSDLILSDAEFKRMFADLEIKHNLADRSIIGEHVLKIILGFNKDSYYHNVVDGKLMIRLFWEDKDKWVEVSSIIDKTLDLKTGIIEDFNPQLFIEQFHKYIEERKSRTKIDFNDWEEWEKWIQDELYILETIDRVTKNKTKYLISNKGNLKLGDGYDRRHISVKTQTNEITSLQYTLESVSNVTREVFSTITFDFKLPTSFINEFIAGTTAISSEYAGIKYFPKAPL